MASASRRAKARGRTVPVSASILLASTFDASIELAAVLSARQSTYVRDSVEA
jgi:hypothetical protein